ncbi:hypothetical protein C8Q80DRAFT_810551 [Daedaleopsis nitida]|nr:hypothetical protein C8Q80DRAFT_810551 [Daedaleopsis nitida]
MDHNNALGLTFNAEPEVYDLPNVDWDSITVVSLQLSTQDRKYTLPFRLPRFGSWRNTGAGRSRFPLASWCNVHSGWSSRLSARVKLLSRRLPGFIQVVAGSIVPGIAPRPPTFDPYHVFSASLSTYQCAACQANIEIIDDASVAVPCGHHYHAECLLNLVESSLHTLAAFPPRCCRQTIPTDIFAPYMPRSLRTAFAERQAEYDTPKRVYCSNPRCSRFLGARDKHIPIRVLTCPALPCGTRTCARCKARVNGPASRHECSHDPGHRATLQLGSRLGWVRCPTCEELIERHGGCAHMTCVCGAQFCYRCRALWKTCNCVDWGDGVGADDGEARLFAPLEEGGDLGERLALWVPPTLERNGNAGRGSDGWTDIQPGVRPRSLSFTFAPPYSLASCASAGVVGTPPRPTTTQANLKTSPLAGPSREVHDANDTAHCFPFLVDPQLIARGVHAQESRRRRRAMSL